MSLQTSRDEHGNVTISNLATGKSEVVATGVAGRPAQKTVAETQGDLPSHSWGQLPSHSWGQLA
jgi:hypothetical protein